MTVKSQSLDRNLLEFLILPAGIAPRQWIECNAIERVQSWSGRPRSLPFSLRGQTRPMADLLHRLQSDLVLLARPRHAQWDPLGLMAVRDLLRERLGALGAVRDHPFEAGANRGINLLLDLPGRLPHLPPLLVGAHYDGP
ncbi:MAG: hypothetical protein ACK55I_32600, partial [bacterium]